MIKLKDLLNLKEAVEKVKPEYTQEAVFKFFDKNKKKLKTLADEDEWDEFYELAYMEFAEGDQDMIATAMNTAALRAGWFENNVEDYRQSEAELDVMANGTKKQQKGIDTAAYDKKAKAPKNTKEDLVQPLKESKIKPAMSTYVMTQSLEVDAEIGGKIYKLKKGDVVKVVEYDEDNGLAFLNINGKVYTTYDLLDTAKFNKGIKLKIVEYKKGGGVKGAKFKHQPLKELKKKIEEAEYQGRKVNLGKPFYTPGGPRKRAVYVKNEKGNVVKVGFGEPGMKIKKNNPARRKSFRARHNCENPGPRWKARYWSCRAW